MSRKKQLTRRWFKIAKLWRWSLLTCMLFIILSLALVLPLRWFAPATSAVMLVANPTQNSYQWRALDKISPYLPLAIIASEDQKFLEHSGFDYDAIWQAIKERRQRKRGASTISQQVVKNLFLWQGRSYVRKALELVLTLGLELLLPKKRILEIYLNIAEMAPNIYGAEAASKKLFRLRASQLSAYQSALIAATLPNPKKLSAAYPTDYVATRAAKIYYQMDVLGGVKFLKKF